ncbi:MAG: hypothetical protein JW779_12740 [Candidatus Thorarchaeota archaeon]|nr:hypothetical protein [Candidatus Thorarchaeota archaeon]
MKEKRREKSKKEVSQEPLETESVDVPEKVTTMEQTHSPEVIVEKKETTETRDIQSSEPQVVEETLQEVTTEFEILMPSWGGPIESEWMYGIPSREEDKILWAEEWADFILQWAEHNDVHILSLSVFISEPPFKDLRNKVDSFKIIVQILIDKEVAEWMDKRKRQLRVYWRPLEDWADYLYEWALKHGKLRLDVKSIVIQESEESFAKLPEKDLYIVLALMVEKGFAEWVDKKRGAIIVVT